ncbi:MAG: 3-dehydroquinate synthase, partial [Bdellovibrionota bacterium]|nr:3-dehydroquinate synthase [Bdellovibrionota bacterium]
MKSCIEQVDNGLLLDKIKNLPTDGIIFLADEEVWRIYGDLFNNLEEKLGKKIIFLSLPQGEKVKNWDVFQSTIEKILNLGIHRNYHLIAFGGGALSDLAGFVASVLLRGISWSVIPTTLLSMVDASIGGKTAINSSLGKNLIGAFHNPDHIWLNPFFLESLPLKEKLNGFGEII